MHHSHNILHFMRPISLSLGLLSDKPLPTNLIAQHLSWFRSMSQITMEELRRNQEAMKVEINQLKTQMSLIMEILQSMLRKEGNPVPTVVPEVISPMNIPDPLPPQEQPHGFHPHPVPPKSQYQRPFPVLRPRQRNPGRNQYPNQQRDFTQQGRQRPRRPPKKFDPVPVSYGRLLPFLLNSSLV